jgi:hypothetical protein
MSMESYRFLVTAYFTRCRYLLSIKQFRIFISDNDNSLTLRQQLNLLIEKYPIYNIIVNFCHLREILVKNDIDYYY